MKLYTYFSDFFGLFYPHICVCCNESLVKNEIILCTQCYLNLPRTNYHTDPENETAKIFWGRVKVENASSYLYFTKGGMVQKLLHKLKYKGEKQVGEFLGRLLGFDLYDTPFSNVDIITPVPIHPKKLVRRGYNQSEVIASGISDVFGKPLITNNLIRLIEKTSQTGKHRYDRWLNVDRIFDITYPEAFENKHVLLVDDVITTGATIESCVTALQKCANVKISVITVAKA